MTIADLSRKVPVLESGDPDAAVLAAFAADPLLRAVIAIRGGRVALVPRHPTGMLRDRRTRSDLALPGYLGVVEAARRMLARAAEQRLDDVLVITEFGPRVVTAVAVLGELARSEASDCLDPLTGALRWTPVLSARRALVGDAVLLAAIDDARAPLAETGSDAADELLCAVARRIRGCLRLGDSLVRVGPGEFAVLLTQVTVHSAHSIGARVAAAVDEPLPGGRSKRTIPLAVGVAVLRPQVDVPSATLGQLLEQARHGLRQSSIADRAATVATT